MTSFALDTNCMIAACCAWHEHHTTTVQAIEARLARGERPAVAAHAVVEAYAVLTRLPSPHRLAPADAWTLLEANFVEGASMGTLTTTMYTRLLRQLAKQSIGGGRVYDAVIGECARRAGAKTLLTFDGRHFDPPPDGVAIVQP